MPAARSGSASSERQYCSGGAPGFFTPRFLTPWLYPHGTIAATNAHDTSSLKATLEELIDFDRLNAGAIRFSIGAVNVRTGNFVYFGTRTYTIGPEHIMDERSLAARTSRNRDEGEHYWDGGLVPNTPLQWVVDSQPRMNTLAFQVDLWSARGKLLDTLAEVCTRKQEIRYSSRTRAGPNNFKDIQQLRRAMADLFEKLPEALRNGREVQLFRPATDHKVYNIVQLIYHAKNYEGHSMDYEFSCASMQEHWRVGYHDAVRTLRQGSAPAPHKSRGCLHLRS